MVLIEFKEAALNNAFEELDEAKKSLKKTKIALCNVEDSLCELYEADGSENEDMNDYEEEESKDFSDGSFEVNYRGRKGMRGGMRRNMRMRMRGYGRYSY